MHRAPNTRALSGRYLCLQPRMWYHSPNLSFDFEDVIFSTRISSRSHSLPTTNVDEISHGIHMVSMAFAKEPHCRQNRSVNMNSRVFYDVFTIIRYQTIVTPLVIVFKKKPAVSSVHENTDGIGIVGWLYIAQIQLHISGKFWMLGYPPIYTAFLQSYVWLQLLWELVGKETFVKWQKIHQQK